jgi:hypothetical protein
VPTKEALPGHPRALRLYWDVFPSGVAGAGPFFRFSCKPKAQRFVAVGATCPKHTEELGLCPHCDGRKLDRSEESP